MRNTHPVTIVDKNGRTTTVHRRSDEKPSMSKSLPTPTVAPQSGTQSTPLEPLAPATRSQTRKLMEEFSSGEEYWPVNLERIVKETSKRDHTLMRRLLDNPVVNNTMVFSCVQYGVKDETISKEEVTNALLILERMYSNGDGHLLDNSGPFSFYHAVLGVDQVGTRPYLDNIRPITTHEELASKSAFTAFILLAEANHVNDDSILRRGNKRFSFKWTRDFLTIQNKHLKDLILDRPDKQHEITDYVRARGMHPKNKRPVDALRAFLDEDVKTTAVSSGWL